MQNHVVFVFRCVFNVGAAIFAPFCETPGQLHGLAAIMQASVVQMVRGKQLEF